MRKVIAAINMTIDGYCDHTAVNPDAEIHQHYADLLHNTGVAVYGRVTYQLMQYWQSIRANPTGKKATDEFAAAIDRVPKLVFSHTLKDTGWNSATLAKGSLEEELTALKQQPGKDIYVCSPGMIVAAMNLNLIDEFQLCVHPVVAGSGLPLFKNIQDKPMFRLVQTKNFTSGAVILYYEPLK
ncbi:dihydrofolate reductase family protein [Cytophaga hutchinsonii]|uniref:Dihydrofolate reductase n=1 Tax=Cytophaga hutchinsonii (strain ATCC 33406 / DSM 1761 / CIP 103989 / NBRC 15051 / NCIMB 9469 / D465) TaxID=269798 RepID=A0A6N4SRT2_CYTH3|nr:dihydrofolate reductase family protein [Cytophaga hutchinsonii]ABG59020.1 dihydrofolate reductase [Cytophaga hutchinsonii ATCC 33406]SFX38811.1 dihydrofolate reductase [Cytophaga hutchinsonii ATCC 33406]